MSVLIETTVDSQYTATIELISRLSRLYPRYGQPELLRLALLLTLHQPGDYGKHGDRQLLSQCEEISLQLRAASDQHAAVAEELESLAATEPCNFSPAHVFTLVRAIKVQNRVLNFYLGPVEADF